MSWIDALKQWNRKRSGRWCIPKKGTREYDEVRALMGGMKGGGKLKGGLTPRELAEAKRKAASAARLEAEKKEHERRMTMMRESAEKERKATSAAAEAATAKAKAATPYRRYADRPPSRPAAARRLPPIVEGFEGVRVEPAQPLGRRDVVVGRVPASKPAAVTRETPAGFPPLARINPDVGRAMVELPYEWKEYLAKESKRTGQMRKIPTGYVPTPAEQLELPEIYSFYSPSALSFGERERDLARVAERARGEREAPSAPIKPPFKPARRSSEVIYETENPMGRRIAERFTSLTDIRLYDKLNELHSALTAIKNSARMGSLGEYLRALPRQDPYTNEYIKRMNIQLSPQDSPARVEEMLTPYLRRIETDLADMGLPLPELYGLGKLY
jgi:hypothetical protein